MKSIIRACLFVLELLMILPLGVSQAFGASDLSATTEPVTDCNHPAEMSFGPAVFIDSVVAVPAAGEMPAHCEVQGTRFYDALIIKLPDQRNGRCYQTGNGGAAGSLGDLSAGLKNNFVAASGHSSIIHRSSFNIPTKTALVSDQIHCTSECLKFATEQTTIMASKKTVFAEGLPEIFGRQDLKS